MRKLHSTAVSFVLAQDETWIVSCAVAGCSKLSVHSKRVKNATRLQTSGQPDPIDLCSEGQEL